jgi:2-succinyl-5-enolpyruvyl-6-hydroxy-3-cyclohexene-1-carboxylate synthase
LIRDAAPSPYILVRPDASRFDPDHRVTHHLETEPSLFCSAMMKRLAGLDLSASAEWAQRWVNADRAVAKVYHDELDAERAAHLQAPLSALNEPMTVRMVTERIPDDHALLLASSMPVRDANRFAAVTGPSVAVHANRGASGIDGTLATAAGLAVGRSAPVTCLIGDLAAVHDLNSLALLQQVPVVVVLINNSGGGIFHFLPIAEQEDVFEPYFATPQTVDFSLGSAAFGISHRAVNSASEFADAYRDAAAEASTTGQSAVVEVQTERDQNHAIHERLDALCAKAVRSVKRGERTGTE